jgi:hypothetical protein
MDEGKGRNQYDSLPIPSYEEATSSRPTSSQSRQGPEEISDDAERQGLLPNDLHSHGHRRPDPGPSFHGYHPPTVESERSSVELLGSANGSERGSAENLRRELEQLEVDDADVANAGSHRAGLLTNRLSKRFSSFTNSLSSLHLPSRFRQYIPSFSFLPRLGPGAYAQLDANRAMIFGRIFGAFLVLAVVYLLIASDALSLGAGRAIGQARDSESVRIFVQDSIDKGGAVKEYLEYLTKDVHLAGTMGDFFYAEWVKDFFERAALEDVTIERFDVYLNYPKEGGRRVAIVHPPQMAWEAVLEEDDSRENPQQTYSPVFHGHSKSGNVTGPLVYANYGSREDFEWLKQQGIPLQGAVVLVRYGGSQGDRALKVKAAELAGAVGCIVYSDLASDGALWPNGRFMPLDGVQRGTVSLMSWVIGDVLSPGWASTPEDENRLEPEKSEGLVNIPSLPISWRDAKPLLLALKGVGRPVPSSWQGGSLTTGYWTGDPNSPQVNLMNMQDEVTRAPIHNVLGRISGWEQSEKKIIVGNHRDAWCVGAADPGSGTAIMLEVVRVFGELYQLGWRPMRTIEFASWDGEEYNMIGSSEHVENRQDELRRHGLAYLNVDTAVSGTEFWAAASPMYEQALLRVLDRTSDPTTNRTLRDLWDAQRSRLEGLGAGSDYVAFQDVAGMSSIDIGFRGQSFPYHSCYDSYDWMTKFGDPTFEYHKVLGQVWALLILEMSERPILPFDLEAYATYSARYVQDLERFVRAAEKVAKAPLPLDLKILYDVTEDFKTEAHIFHEWERSWTELVSATGGFENNVMAIKRMSHNSRAANFETHLLDLEDGGGVGCISHTPTHVPAPLIYLEESADIGLRSAREPYAIQTCAVCPADVVGIRRGILPRYQGCSGCGRLGWCPGPGRQSGRHLRKGRSQVEPQLIVQFILINQKESWVLRAAASGMATGIDAELGRFPFFYVEALILSLVEPFSSILFVHQWSPT